MSDLENAELWELAYDLDPYNADKCAEVDPHLANKIEDINDLSQIYYYLCYGSVQKNLPATRNKVNQLFLEELKKGEGIDWFKFRRFYDWLGTDIKQQLAEKWLDDDESAADTVWVVNTTDFTSEIGIKILEKLTKIYKKRKSKQNIHLIETIFVSLDKDFINDASKILASSTPAVAASLLRRSDIDEKHTLKGLKALSKLSKQRDVEIKIDFDMLQHLGPKGRLDAMKQLMGMFDKYYKWQQQYNTQDNRYYYRRRKPKERKYDLPFKEVPSKDDVEKFLFPCSLKYNDEVVAMMERYNELVNLKGGK